MVPGINVLYGVPIFAKLSFNFNFNFNWSWVELYSIWSSNPPPPNQTQLGAAHPQLVFAKLIFNFNFKQSLALFPTDAFKWNLMQFDAFWYKGNSKVEINLQIRRTAVQCTLYSERSFNLLIP